MSYSKIFRGEFSNALADENNEAVEQIVRIDISDTTTGSGDVESVVCGVIAIGITTLQIAPTLPDPIPSYEERLAIFNTLLSFFYIGQRIDVDGTPSSDGVVTILTIHPSPPIPSLATMGSIQFDIPESPTPAIGINDVTLTDVTDPTIIPLQMSGDPLHITSVDNNEDKLDPAIRSKNATISIHTSELVDINTFCEGTDVQFYVEILVDDLIVFRGFLIIPDMEEQFMPRPNVLVLKASDNLKTLKNINLVDDDDQNPLNDWRLIDYLRWSLMKTGIRQNINIVNNLKHGTGSFEILTTFISSAKEILVSDAYANKFYPGMSLNIAGSASNDGNYTVRAVAIENILGFDFAIVFVNESLTDETDSTVTFTDNSSSLPFHQVVYLDAKTFEKEINLSEDAYTVIGKILGEDSILFQHQGEWWIVRIDEIEEIAGIFEYKVNRFDIEDGELLGSSTIVKQKDVGVNASMNVMNDDPIVIPDRALAKVKLTYRFTNPLELICNIDFSRGEFIEDMPNVTIANDTFNAKKYDIDCWINTSAPFTPGQTSPAPSFDAYIKLLYQNGYEKHRFAVIPTNTGNTDFLESAPIKMNSRDKFDISVDFAWDQNISSSDIGGEDTINLAIYFVTLQGYDGTNWYLDNSGKWTQTFPAGTWTGLNGIMVSWGVDDVDETIFRSVPVSADPLPVSGLIRIALNSIGQSEIPDRDMYYNNIQLSYIPFVNGSYQRYTGHVNQVSQNIGYTSIREKEVYMSDTFSVLFKGAMKFDNGITKALAYGFTDSHWLNATQYGKIQAYAVWNQYRRNLRNFEEDVDFIDSDSVLEDKYDGVDLIHKINLTDLDVSTNPFLFMLLHYDQDLYLLEMKAYFASLYRKDVGKIYTDLFDFKYITQ